MIFGWLKRRRRRKLLSQPFPAAWEDLLRRHVWQYGRLPEADRATLRDRLRVFIAEKNFEGCGGLEMRDAVRVTVAAYACLLTLRLDRESYDHVLSVLVYPKDYAAPETTVTAGGLWLETTSHRSGEAWSEGAVVLSWDDVIRNRRGSNVAIHEFAHELDMINRDVDGTPPLEDGRLIPAWRKVMRDEHEQLAADVEAGRRTVIDPYGATDVGEFFAVCTELFFEVPGRMQRDKPVLYRMLREYYGQDSVGWIENGDPR